uniref:hypothetical protein n=1 Tax=Escherichia coli TaxID=562 RepID=UPI000AC472C0
WQPEFTDKILSRKPGAVHYDDDYYRERPCPGEVFGYDNSEDNDEAASDYALKINESSD